LLSSRKRTLNLSVSGNRSASAANALAKPGYTNVWNPVEGHADGKRLAKCRPAMALQIDSRSSLGAIKISGWAVQKSCNCRLPGGRFGAEWQLNTVQ
jgi:hypothetical protein